jgi:class 3 adenylate cyclase
MPDSVSSPARAEHPLLVVFADLTRFMTNARGTPDTVLADLLDGYYRAAARLVGGAGGRVVKFMGDAFLNVVNIAATLPARTVALSPEAFRCLGEAERKAWKKHTPQVVYIPSTDPRP